MTLMLYRQTLVATGEVYWDVIQLLLLILLMTVRGLTPDPQTSLHPRTSICMQMEIDRVHVNPVLRTQDIRLLCPLLRGL